MTEKSVTLMSGGIDSATCTALALSEGEDVKPIHIDYGQQTEDLEQQMARKQREYFVEGYPNRIISDLEVVDYTDVFNHFPGGVAESGKDFGHMEEDDGRSSGYVPMRNLHLIATAAAIADTDNCDHVYHGAQAGDEADYPDCRPEFMDKAAGAISKSVPDDRSLNLKTPLITREKAEVIQLGSNLGVPFQYTYSCYTKVDDVANPEPCGDCPACVERAKAFEAAGVEDPHNTEIENE